MPLQVGIGVATYNRCDVLAATLEHIAQHTKYPFVSLAVSDDGSTDGTMDMLRQRGVLAVTGQNMGIAWNKNRVLFLLTELLRCDLVILLEDDSYPGVDSWEQDWMKAALKWGHAGLAGEWMTKDFLSGTGTPDDPIRSKAVTAQCSVYSREALLFGGYFDPRFRGYGHEHVEHSRRLVRCGYGGNEEKMPDGRWQTVFLLLRGGVQFAPAPTTFNQEQVDRNFAVAQKLFFEFHYRAPWSNEEEMQQFRSEMRNATPRVL